MKLDKNKSFLDSFIFVDFVTSFLDAIFTWEYFTVNELYSLDPVF